MEAFKWILDLHLRYPFRLFYVLIMTIVEVFLYLYPINITANIIQQVLDGSTQGIGQSLVFLFFFAIFQAGIYFTINFINETLAHRVTTDMTQELFESLQVKSLRYHDGIDVGQIMARATGDTRTVNTALSPGIVRTLILLTAWFIAFFISIVVHWSLIIFTTIFFSLYLYSLYHFTKERIEISREVLIQFANLNELGLRSISGIREIKSFAVTNSITNTFELQNKKHIKALTHEGEKSAWFYPALVATFYAASMIVISVYFASIRIITFRDVVLITGVIIFVRAFSSDLQWQARVIIAAIAATKRVYNLIHEDDPGKYNAEEFHSVKGIPATIKFRNVSFRYQEDLPLVLKDVDFGIEENQTIAIVGGPGSGKSTLTKLIQRLYLPSSGQVFLGGKPIEHFHNNELRKFISTVEQDIFLFNKSISENICFGKPNAKKAEIERVAKIAQAHEFIISFPKGYDTVVGEGGVKLSGGQAQRLSIARALLVDPSILIMDDGASALDAKTEMKIQQAISDILQTRTTIITTHRLSIIAKADRVLILHKGEVVGLGPHKELIRKNSYYRQLFEHHYELPPLQVGD